MKRDGNVGVRVLLAQKEREEAKDTAERMDGKKSYDFGASMKRAKVEKNDKMEEDVKPFGIVPKRAQEKGDVVHSGATMEFNDLDLED